jgi:hypothetical protein
MSNLNSDYLAIGTIYNTIINEYDTVLVKQINEDTSDVILFVLHGDIDKVNEHYKVLGISDNFYTFSTMLIRVPNTDLLITRKDKLKC